MNTDEDYVRTLIERQTKWRYLRWFQLLSSVLGLVGAALLLCEAHKRASAAELWDEDAVVLYPMGMALLVVGLMLLVMLLFTWRGDPVIAVVLSLLRRTDRAAFTSRNAATNEDYKHPPV
jgi:hypothetical protein